jgi:hypothetical protein
VCLPAGTSQAVANSSPAAGQANPVAHNYQAYGSRHKPACIQQQCM